jgi:intracellular sulfur oxidation DsrE/DsrF family protein
MLAAGGVDADHRQIVVVLHGAATTAVLSDAAWVARGKGAANPNSALIRALLAAGVQVRLCGQAMAGNGVTEAELEPGVTVDLAALMTVIHHQQAGYALIVN